MHNDVRLVVELSPETEARLARIEALLKTLNRKENMVTQTLQELTDEVTREGTVVGSAVVLLNGLTQKINDLIAAGNDDPQLAALRDTLKAQTDALAAGVVANTPAA